MSTHDSQNKSLHNAFILTKPYYVCQAIKSSDRPLNSHDLVMRQTILTLVLQMPVHSMISHDLAQTFLIHALLSNYVYHMIYKCNYVCHMIHK